MPLTSCLLVPIRVDLLYLATETAVVGPNVQFGRLPYWDGEKQVNPDVAYISEKLVADPFEGQKLWLGAGIHLHWALPAALTQGDSGGGRGFPTVPNRWLVSRFTKGNAKPEAQWIIESDYIAPDGEHIARSGVAVPFPADPAKGRHHPFVHLGRKSQFKADWQEPAAAEHLAGLDCRLTAVGYEAAKASHGHAEPTFAALYSNCFSVFGCHDSDARDPAELEYEVVGWYSRPDWDPLASNDFARALVTARTKAAPAQVYEQALAEAFGWGMTGAPTKAPERTLLYSRVTLAPNSLELPSSKTSGVTVAVGDTPTQALSAFLARRAAQRDGQPNAEDERAWKLEKQLEALHLADELAGLASDIGANFQEARHDQGFTRLSGGRIWSIRRPAAATPGAEAARESTSAALELPERVAHQLNALNTKQQALDRARADLTFLRRQLFADWYKYMLCSYPPDHGQYPSIDAVRDFIACNGLYAVELAEEKHAGLARDCERLHGELAREVLEFGKARQQEYALKPRPAPRYYRPHEPALLLAGDGVGATVRHSRRRAPVTVQELPVGTPAAWFEPLHACLDRLQNDAKLGKLASHDADHEGAGVPALEAHGFHTWQRQPWHPFRLDWRVRLHPLAHTGNNLHADRRSYDPGFIAATHALPSNGVDLKLTAAAKVQPAACRYTGTSILTPHPRFQLLARLDSYLSKRLLTPYFDAQNVPSADRTPNYFKANRAAILDWYASDKARKDSVLDTILAACEDIAELEVLAQSLSGFNEALLMRKQIFQLPVEEPFGFEDARVFTAKVREKADGQSTDASGRHARTAPAPENDFQPIRCGLLALEALHLVDTFGLVREIELEPEKFVTTELMAPPPELIKDLPPRQRNVAWLPPRLAQPARLNLRWLAAESDEQEMNAHPATSPICGWLVPNHLDQSLSVYDPSGRGLGALVEDQQGLVRAEPVPGSSRAELPSHGVLGGVLSSLRSRSGELRAFVGNLETALHRIDPRGFAEDDALALLIGRPLAIVRVQLGLVFRSKAAQNEGWAAFRRELARDQQAARRGETGPIERESDGFAQVRFPVRLGDTRKLHDGLVGFWREDEPDFKFGEECCVSLTPGAEPVILTLLMDPRAAINARSGVLPAKSIEIPRSQYAAALKAMQVVFLTAPVLSPVPRASQAAPPSTSSAVAIPVPSAKNATWSWWAPPTVAGEAWRESAVTAPNAVANWDDHAPIQVLEGWLSLTRNQR